MGCDRPPFPPPVGNGGYAIATELDIVRLAREAVVRRRMISAFPSDLVSRVSVYYKLGRCVTEGGSASRQACRTKVGVRYTAHQLHPCHQRVGGGPAGKRTYEV